MADVRKHPCYECDIWKRYGSPDYLMYCPGPQKCSKTQSYLKGIGPAGIGSVPIMTTEPEKNKPLKELDNIANHSKMKRCCNKNCKHTGALQPLSNFYKNRNNKKDGLQKWCKDCMKIQSRKTYKNHTDSKNTKIIPNKKEIEDEISPDPGRYDESLLDELFSCNNDLLEKLKEISSLEFRTPKNQIMYLISSYKMED